MAYAGQARNPTSIDEVHGIASNRAVAPTPAALMERLRSYFVTPDLPPHPWFERWTEALAPLAFAYTRNAAHLDVSSRTTASLSAAPDQAGFRMLDNAARWLFKRLSLLPTRPVLFLAGPMTGRPAARPSLGVRLHGGGVLRRPLSTNGLRVCHARHCTPPTDTATTIGGNDLRASSKARAAAVRPPHHA